MIKQLLVAAVLFTTPALAETPWLIKSQDSGYVQAQDWQSFVCHVYSDRIELYRAVGESGIWTKQVRPLTLEGDLATEIRLAADEPIEGDGTMCDAPGTKITAHLPTDTDGAGLLLFGHSTCSQDGERKGEHSTPLVNLANGLCGSL